MTDGGIVAVHAHPDDESITMGATLARYACSGVPVTLVTATLGEHGELMHGRFGGLDADHADQLGGYRFAELQRACAAMGITDQRMLGGLGCFRDSGMAGEPSAEHPRAFIHAQRGGSRHTEAAGYLAAILAELRPRVVITYDATGGYGHPDHIAAHQVTVAAVEMYDASARIRLLEVVRTRDAVAEHLDALWEAPLPDGYRRPSLDDLGTLVDRVDVSVQVGTWRAARRAAMAAHATQLDVWPGAVDGFALTNMLAQPLLPTESYRVLRGPQVPAGAADLFSGL